MSVKKMVYSYSKNAEKAQLNHQNSYSNIRASDRFQPILIKKKYQADYSVDNSPL
jgi:hypothetical protein